MVNEILISQECEEYVELAFTNRENRGVIQFRNGDDKLWQQFCALLESEWSY